MLTNEQIKDFRLTRPHETSLDMYAYVLSLQDKAYGFTPTTRTNVVPYLSEEVPFAVCFTKEMIHRDIKWFSDAIVRTRKVKNKDKPTVESTIINFTHPEYGVIFIYLRNEVFISYCIVPHECLSDDKVRSRLQRVTNSIKNLEDIYQIANYLSLLGTAVNNVRNK